MEKTIDEVLFDRLRQTRRMNRDMMPKGGRRPPHMEGPHMPPEEGSRPPHMEGRPHPGMHGERMLPRERILQVILEGGEDGMRQKDILEEVHVNPSSLSELINKLESDRYIERKADPEDKRATRIFLSEKGKARAYEVIDAHREACAKMFANLNEEEKNQLLVLLDKILIKE